MVEQAALAGNLSAHNIAASDISLIIKEKITSSLLNILKQGSITEANLIDVSAGADGSLSGILNINGKLLTAAIPQELYNEFALGKAFNNNFDMPIRLKLENAARSSIQSNAANESALGSGGGSGLEVIFKVVGDSADNINIQKALDLYNKVFSENLESNIGSAFKSLLTSGLNPLVQNVTASVKGNFLFIHINFGSSIGLGSVILTANNNYAIIKDAPDKKNTAGVLSKKYMLMLETDFNALGHIKLFSYYSGNSLSVKFQECSDGAKELINKNIGTFKEMLSEDGITLKDLSFNSVTGKDLKAGKKTGIFSSGGEIFSEGNIINERV